MLARALPQIERPPSGIRPVGAYRPRSPTETLLYRVVQEHFLPFVREREAAELAA